MKLAFAFIFACLALTSVSSQYVELTQAQINANAGFLEDIRGFGVGYVIQKGVFESPNAPFPGENDNYNLTRVEKIERRSTNAAAYYRFTVILDEDQGLATVRATFTIRYDHRNGAFIVSDWRYTFRVTGEDNIYEDAFVPLDVRGFNDGSIHDLPDLNERIQDIIADGIANNEIPDSTYSLRFVYYGVQSQSLKEIWVKVVNTQNEYYRIHFQYVTPPASQPDLTSRIQPNSRWIRV